MIPQILQFMYAKGAGEAALRRLFAFAEHNSDKDIKKCFTSSERIADSFSIKPDVARHIINADKEARSIAEQLEKENIIAIWIGHKLYPPMLTDILGDCAPPVIFCKGNIELLKKHGVGFCGSRKASEKGLTITGKCAELLVEKDICVISGYAHGVDLSAHRAALENGGDTIFVLVEGILRFQKKKDVAALLSAKNYLAVSQFPPLLSWTARNAMRRNATIIGLSEAMILVESGLSGGTFAAGEETLKRHQPLFVIDFAAPGPSAEANPYFIKQGGVAIRGNREGRPNLEKVLDIISSRQKKTPANDNAIDIKSIKAIPKMQQGKLLS